jgi:hypothetical protein
VDGDHRGYWADEGAYDNRVRQLRARRQPAGDEIKVAGAAHAAPHVNLGGDGFSGGEFGVHRRLHRQDAELARSGGEVPSIDQLLPGDLVVVWSRNVAMVTGDGQMVEGAALGSDQHDQDHQRRPVLCRFLPGRPVS